MSPPTLRQVLAAAFTTDDPRAAVERASRWCAYGWLHDHEHSATWRDLDHGLTGAWWALGMADTGPGFGHEPFVPPAPHYVEAA